MIILSEKDHFNEIQTHWNRCWQIKKFAQFCPLGLQRLREIIESSQRNAEVWKFKFKENERQNKKLALVNCFGLGWLFWFENLYGQANEIHGKDFKMLFIWFGMEKIKHWIVSFGSSIIRIKDLVEREKDGTFGLP